MSETNTTGTVFPKARFMDSGDNISKHNKIVDDPAFQRGCDFSILQYAAFLTKSQANANEASINAIKLQGAHEFVEIFRSLGVKPPLIPERIVTPGNLNHRVS